jgi:hypothetical protein
MDNFLAGLNKHAPLFFSVLIAILLQHILSLEWSRPICQSLGEGDSSAFGFPFPYTKWSGVSSLEFNIMPHMYLANVLILSMLVFVPTRNIFSKYLPVEKLPLRTIVGAVSLTIAILFFCANVFLLFDGTMFSSVQSIGDKTYGTYFDYRPVSLAITGDGSYDCKASDFWFSKPEKAMK